MDSAGHYTGAQQGDAFDPAADGAAVGSAGEGFQHPQPVEADAIERRLSALERLAYGQASEALPEPQSGETGAGYQDGAGFAGAQVAEEGAATGHAQDAGDLAAGMRAYLLDVTRDLTRNANRALAECRWNPGALAAADAAFAAAEQATQEGRALLTALASCPPPQAPTPEQARAAVMARQQAALDRLHLLIWQTQGYANLIAASPFNTPATLAMEQALGETRTETDSAVFGLGTALRDARLVG